MDNPNQRIVKTGAGDVVVRKLALKDYADLIRKLRKLPKELAFLFQSEKDIKDMGVLFAELPELVAESWGDLIGVISTATDKDEEFFQSDDIDLADGVDILEALLELNNYQRVVDSIKKIMARAQPKKPETETKPAPVEPPKK